MQKHDVLNKVSFFLPSLRGGGAEKVMLSLANSIVKKGFSVDLLLVSAEGPYMNSISSQVNVIDLKSKKTIKSLPKLIGYLKSVKPQVIISAMTHANTVLLLASKIACSNSKVIITEHGYYSLSEDRKDGYKSLFYHNLTKKLYQSCENIITVSNGVADDLSLALNIPRSQIKTIYNPIDIEEIKAKSKDPIDESFFEQKSKYTIISVGRLIDLKDYRTLLHAFSKVRAELDANLLILGEGSCRLELENEITKLKIDNYVKMPGFKINPYNYLKNSDLFVLSSKTEGLPTVLIEAMACSTQVVSTNCPSGPYEILEGGKYGRLVPVGDVNALANAIKCSLLDTKKPDVEKRSLFFSVENATKNYMQVIFDLKIQ